MKCKSCKRIIDDTDIFCRYCGKSQLREKHKKEVTVPKPRKLASGTWFGQLMVHGERVCVSADSEREYYTQARALKSGLLEVRKKSDDPVLKDAIDKYIQERGARLRETSKANYEYIRDKRFQTLMSKRLSELTDIVCDTAIGEELALPSRRGGTISPKTVEDAFNLIATVIERYSGRTVSVSMPEVQRKFPKMLTPNDAISVVKGTDLELPALLSMWLTLSASEIRGLTKSKSVREGKLYVVETVVNVKGKAIRREGAKEEERPRCLSIPKHIQDLIDAVDGDVIEPRSVRALNARFHKLQEKAGIPEEDQINFHKLRHIAASIMAEEQIPSNVAQDRGGWKTDSTMKSVYTHTFDNTRTEADKKIDARFEHLLGN